jgi:hypothetical protein
MSWAASTTRRAFGLLPILADALLDAGCDGEELLAHCRRWGRTRQLAGWWKPSSERLEPGCGKSKSAGAISADVGLANLQADRAETACERNVWSARHTGQSRTNSCAGQTPVEPFFVTDYSGKSLQSFFRVVHLPPILAAKILAAVPLVKIGSWELVNDPVRRVCSARVTQLRRRQ